MVINFSAGATVPTVEEAGGLRIAVILVILIGALSQERNMVSNIHFTICSGCLWPRPVFDGAESALLAWWSLVKC